MLGLVACFVDSDGGDGLYCHVETEHGGAVVFDGGGGDRRHLCHRAGLVTTAWAQVDRRGAGGVKNRLKPTGCHQCAEAGEAGFVGAVLR